MPEITHTWEHPTLGTFDYDFVGWSRELEIPSFAQYGYVRGGGYKLGQKVKLSFESEDRGDDRPIEPSNDAILLANKIISNQQSLNERVLNAVWEDLNGRGPDTGMWWHGDRHTIHEAIHSEWRSTPPPLDAKQDLYKLMGRACIYVKPNHQDYKRICSLIAFDSAIAPGHGIGVLCDGQRILGVGYSYCVSLYRNE